MEATDDGYYQAGSYYEYIIEVINDAVSRYNSYNGASVSSYSASSSSALYNFAAAYKSATKGMGAFDDYDGVEDVDFETIWNQGHTEAEDSGDASDNFISWVQECVSDFRNQ